jgi:hypothetical protein
VLAGIAMLWIGALVLTASSIRAVTENTTRPVLV